MRIKLGEKNKRLLAGISAVVLTAIYLVATGAVATKAVTTEANVNYTELVDTAFGDQYTDVYKLTEANHSSQYGKITAAKTVKIYTSKSKNDSASEPYSLASHYGTIRLNDHDKPSDEVAVQPIAHSALYQGYTVSSAPVAATLADGTALNMGSVTALAMSADASKAVYTAVPRSEGVYYIYIYSDTEVAPTVQYNLISGYAAANAFVAGTPTGTLELTKVSDKWWRGSIAVDNLSWNCYSVEHSGIGNAASATTDSFTKDGGSSQPLSSSFVLSDSYYYNTWTVTTNTFDTLIALSWTDASLRLGGISKADTLTISANTEHGTVEAFSIFGESVAVGGTANVIGHVPVYVAAKATGADPYTFVFNEGMFDSAINAYRYEFTGSAQLVTEWEPPEALPNIQMSINSGVQQMLDFAVQNRYNTSAIRGIGIQTSFSVSCPDGVEFKEISYQVSGDQEMTGTLTAESPTVTVSTMWNATTVTFTVISENGTTKKITYTASVKNPDDVVATIGNTGYAFVEDAIMEATSGQTIVITKNSSFVSGTPDPDWILDNAGYTVKQGVTLLLPLEAGYTTVDTETKTNGESSTFANANKKFTKDATGILDPNAGVHVTLTVPGNITLNISGKLCIGGTVYGVTGESISGAPAGAHSNLQLDGTMNVASGGVLSAVGYVLGDGNINVASNGTIYQLFTILDYRSGGYTVSAAGEGNNIRPKTGETYVSPFLRYALLNVQSSIHLASGGKINVFCTMYTGETKVILTIPAQYNVTEATLIGSDNALLNIANGGSLDVAYDSSAACDTYPLVGKTTITLKGGGNLGSLAMNATVAGVEATVETKLLTFPVPYNYEVILAPKDGSEETAHYTIGNSIGFLPGSTLRVEEGAELEIKGSGKIFAVYDGLYDHTSAGNGAESTYGTQGAVPYPTTNALNIATFNYGTAAFIVDGTVNVGSGVQFGAIVQTNGGGVISFASDAKMSCETQIGLAGKTTVLIVKEYAFAGGTVRTLKAQIVGCNGELTDAKAGATYVGTATEGVKLNSYSFTHYTKNDGSKTTPNPVVSFPENTKVYGQWECQSCTESEPVQENVIEATCAAEGSYDSVVYCSVCGCELRRETIVVSKSDHAWTVTYDFANDGSRCTATRVCDNDASHVENAMAEINSAVKTPATVSEMGWTTYTATFKGVDWAEPQTLEVKDIPVLPRVALAAAECFYDSEILLQMKFVVNDPELLASGSKAKIVLSLVGRWGTRTATLNLAAGESSIDDEGRYLVAIGVPSGEMTRGVTIKVIDNNGTEINLYGLKSGQKLENFSFSVKDYIKSVVTDNGLAADTEMRAERIAAAKALAVYGGYAQLYFDTFTDDLAYNVVDIDTKENISIDLSEASPEKLGANTIKVNSAAMTGLVIKNYEAFLDYEIYLSFGFALEEGYEIGNYSFAIFTDETEDETDRYFVNPELDSASGIYYVKTEGIPAAMLDNGYRVVVTSKDSSDSSKIDVTASVMSWANDVVRQLGGNEQYAHQANLAKALYLYNARCNAIFDNAAKEEAA